MIQAFTPVRYNEKAGNLIINGGAQAPLLQEAEGRIVDIGHFGGQIWNWEVP